MINSTNMTADEIIKHMAGQWLNKFTDDSNQKHIRKLFIPPFHPGGNCRINYSIDEKEIYNIEFDGNSAWFGSKLITVNSKKIFYVEYADISSLIFGELENSIAKPELWKAKFLRELTKITISK